MFALLVLIGVLFWLAEHESFWLATILLLAAGIMVVQTRRYARDEVDELLDRTADTILQRIKEEGSEPLPPQQS